MEFIILAEHFYFFGKFAPKVFSLQILLFVVKVIILLELDIRW